MSIQHRLARVAIVAVVGLLLTGSVWAQGTGNANFSRYVALGDSLTAGFISGGLVADVQRVSYPALIHRQATGSSSGFEQPLVSAPGLPPTLQLVSVSPLIIAPASGVGNPTNLFLPRPYDNLAVPGADVDDLLSTRSGGLHDLILRGLGTQLEQAIFLQPTFATLWIGNNDALGAATSGIVIDDVTLTSAAVFEAKFRTAAGALASNGVQLALATIPSVTAIPFVTTIAPVVVNPTTNRPVRINGQVVPLIGPNGPLRPGRDFVLLTATTELAQGRGIPVALGGSGQPLSNSAVLSAEEAAAIGNRVNEFNRVIRAVANETGAALADINAIFGEIAAHGFEVGGINFTTAFLTGGLFSADGVHATPFGYAVVANAFIDAINRTYGASIPPVNYGDYIFGSLASLGTGYPVSGPVLFSRAADDNLRFALGVPSRETLQSLAQPGGGGDGNGGGDSGGNGSGDGNGGGDSGTDPDPEPPPAPPEPEPEPQPEPEPEPEPEPQPDPGRGGGGPGPGDRGIGF